MHETRNDDRTNPEGPLRWLDKPAGLWAAWLALALFAGVLVGGNLARIGLWEPWEAGEIRVALESRAGAGGEALALPAPAGQGAMAPAAPIALSEGQPTARPWLKTWLISQSLGHEAAGLSQAGPKPGQLEWRARLPGALAALLLVFMSFAWLGQYWGRGPALVSAMALASAPAIYLGGRFASAEMILVLCSSAAIMAFAQLVFASRHHLWWALGFGVSLALGFLDHRLVGVYLPLAVLAAWALVQLSTYGATDDDEADRKGSAPAEAGPETSEKRSLVGRAELLLGAVPLGTALGVILWGFWRTAQLDNATGIVLAAEVRPWLWVSVPALLIAGALGLARRTAVGQALVSLPGVVAALVVFAAFAASATQWADNAAVIGVAGQSGLWTSFLTWLLENRVASSSAAADHMHFALWMRQIGFATMPWAALVPLALAWLGHRAPKGSSSEGGGALVRGELRQLLLIWALVGLVFTSLASNWGHFFYPAWVPLMAGVGLMMTDGAWWASMRRRPMLMGVAGFVAVCAVLMLGKDLERYPDRLIELFVGLEKTSPLPEDFAWGKSLKALKYLSAALLGVYFFGLVSWAGVLARNARDWPELVRRWRARRRAGSVSPEQGESLARRASGASAMVRAVEHKEALRRSPTPLGRLARALETPASASLLLCLLFGAMAWTVGHRFIPSASAHLSQRGVFEAYRTHAKSGEPLLRYGLSEGEASVYLQGTQDMGSSATFLARFKDATRFFAVMPRQRLAQLNTDVRQAHGQNVAVLDASSSRLLLVSNQLAEGEEDHNFIARAIVENEAEVQHRLTFGPDEQKSPATLDKQLELLGYSLDRKGPGSEPPTYRPGESLTVTLYFRVLKRVSNPQKVFMHIDKQGQRIHGDHDPVQGQYPTNLWLPGDIVKDVHTVSIDNYASVGVYTIHAGMFRNNRRMQVEPRAAHDGQNRLVVGRVRIAP